MSDADRTQAQDQADPDCPASHWAPHALCGFPDDELVALGHIPTDLTYAAWIHARRGHGVDWITRHFGLDPAVVGTLVAHASSLQRLGDATSTS